MAGTTPSLLSTEFDLFSRSLNPFLAKPILHASLSVPRDETQSDTSWYCIAKDYMDGMGFSKCQYVTYRHTDRQHDHIHIIAGRIQQTDGKTVSDSWDYYRSERLIRQLEAQYALSAPLSSREKGECSLTTGEARVLAESGQRSDRQTLQTLLNQTLAPNMTMPQLIATLRQQGVSIRVTQKKDGEMTGISYKLGQVAFSGTHLGRDFTFPGLQKHRQISYDAARDNAAIATLLQSPPPVQSPAIMVPVADSAPSLPATALLDREPVNASTPPKAPASATIDPAQREAAEYIGSIAIRFFLQMKEQGAVHQSAAQRWTLDGQQYNISYDREEDEFIVAATDGRGDLLKLQERDRKAFVGAAQKITLDDVTNFYRIAELTQPTQRQQQR